eukprot:6772424-Heterocapsa_arctica.AAC.1
MVENHKDKISQKQEEAEAIRTNNNRKMNNDIQEEDQVHKYVHGGLLQINAPDDINFHEGQMTGGPDVQQNTPEV